MAPDTLTTPPDAVDAAGEAPGEDTERALRRLLELVQAGPPPSQFYRRALECIAAATGTPHATLEVRLPGEVIEHEVAADSERADFWRRNLQKHLTDTLSRGKPHAKLFESARLSSSIAFLGVPLLDGDGRGIGALALVVATRDPQDVREQLTFLHCTSLVAAAYTEAAPPAQAQAADAGSGPSGAKLLERLGSFSSSTELAFEITNKVRNRESCAQVALGRVKGRSVRLLSISGLDDYKKRSPQVLALQAAMEECLDLGAPVVSTSAGGANDAGGRHLLHEHWCQVAGGGAAVASVPLALGEGGGAILSLRRDDGRQFDVGQLRELAALVEPYVAGMGFVDRANQGLGRHALQALGRACGGWRRPRQWLTKALFALPVALALFLTLGRLPYRVSVPCVLVPDVVHNLSAPFDGVLRSSPRVAGDRVAAGDVLASFDTTDLELERGQLQSELEILALRYRSALAGGLATECELLQAQRRQLTGRLELVEGEIQRSEVRAPFDGVLLTGDLRERVGDQVLLGELLFRVSPTREWKLELEVPERRIAHLEAGQSGSFAIRARPEDRHELTLRRVLPSAEQREGATVYVAEADIAFQVDWLLAGMEGVAVVEVGGRPAWWVVFHDALDSLRMGFWL